MLKTRLQSAWNWIKDKARRFKKWIIGIVIGGTAIALAATVIAPPIIPSIDFNGEIITFPYTDDNSGENLIIYTDKQTYGGWDGADVYIMIENKSGEKQETKIKFLFPSKKGEKLSEISRLEKDIPYEIIVENTTTTCSTSTIEVYSTSTLATTTEIITTCQEEVISTSTEIRYRDEWQKLVEFEDEAEFSLPKDKIAYFKTHIQFPRRTKDEFIIEITGDKQGWGKLK